jgi:hypothetical protein
VGLVTATRRAPAGLAWLAAASTLGCNSIDRFDTSGNDAYCGSVVAANFIRTTEAEDGFDRTLRARLEIDASALSTVPGVLTTDDGDDGPCANAPTFDAAPLLVTPELLHDPLSQLAFGDAQDHNLVTWVESTCRGYMLAVVSLRADDRVELRLLKPPEAGSAAPRPAFALFTMSRRRQDCGF